jgi:hypothetical protein
MAHLHRSGAHEAFRGAFSVVDAVQAAPANSAILFETLNFDAPILIGGMGLVNETENQRSARQEGIFLRA